MELHYGKVSGNSARALFGLFELGLPFTPRLVDTRQGENRAADYLALNPMGKIPSLTDGALQLWESNAINLYAAEKTPDRRLIPSAPAERASLYRWLFFQAAHVSPACLPLFRATYDKTKAFWGGQVSPEAVSTARAELARFLPVLEQALVGRTWLQDDFSLADIAFAPHLWMVAQGRDGYDFTRFPALAAWLERVWSRPAWTRTRDLVFGD